MAEDPEMAQTKPYISIIILIGAQRARAERALASVLDQEHLDQAEVLLLDTAYDKYPPIIGSEHSGIRVIDCTNATSYGGLRARGVHLAQGEAVAFLEDHAEACPGWLNCLIRGFRAGYDAMGGIPQVSNPGVGFSDLFEVIGDKSATATSTVARVTNVLTNQNSAYRREILLSFGDLLPTVMFCDYLLDVRLAQKGYTLMLDPEFQFLHANLENTLMIRGNYFHWNKIFGRFRAEVFRWLWARRMLQILATPILPVIRYFKYLLQVYKYNRSKLPRFFRYTGPILYIQIVAAAGIAMGCLFDVKEAEQSYLRSELDWDHHNDKQNR